MKRIARILTPGAFILGILLIFGAVGGLEQGVMTVAQCIGTAVAGLFVLLVSGMFMEEML